MKSLKIPVEVFKKVCPQSPLFFFFSGNNHLLKTESVNQIFPAEPFFLEFLTKCLSKCPNFTKPPLP